MSTYFIGDIHGCYKHLQIMLDHINFNPNADTLYFTGDLVSRGPNSLEVLRLIRTLEKHAFTVLGNHDLHLLKTYFETHNNVQLSTHSFDSILYASDSDELIYWLRQQPILHIDEEKKILMIHAGIHPNWNIHNIKQYAQEIETILISNNPYILFTKEFKKISHTNSMNIKKLKNIQKNINIFTKIRYIYANGQLNMQYKNDPEYAPKNIYPWFNIPRSIPSEYSIIFGHWASLKNKQISSNIYGLDSGCCWGGSLSALRWENKEIIQISCAQCI